MKKPVWVVTGGAGFIGSNITEELVRRGEAVRVFDNFSTGKKGNLAPFLNKIQLIKGDIRNPEHLKKAMKGAAYVLHQAALRSVPRSVDNPVDADAPPPVGLGLGLRQVRQRLLGRFGARARFESSLRDGHHRALLVFPLEIL